DGVPVRSFTVPAPADGTRPGTTRQVTIPFDAVTGQRFRLVVDAVRPKFTTVLRNRPKVEAPVAIAGVGLAGVPVPAAAGAWSPACRSDLVQVNDVPVAVRIVGTAAEARSGLAITPCAGAIALARGSNT